MTNKETKIFAWTFATSIVFFIVLIDAFFGFPITNSLWVYILKPILIVLAIGLVIILCYKGWKSNQKKLALQEEERQRLQTRWLQDQAKHAARERKQLEAQTAKIKELEQLARKGDLIAFHEWKKLTNNHRVDVDVRSIPQIEFSSVGFGITF